jgi:pimeloyl-ACP methyl ester carboxylesterase
MQSHYITGGGGTRLHVLETGNPHGHSILFIHGFSQSGLCWARQLDSDLATDHRLVAMDLRGHGLSDKPRDEYGDSKLWADDVNAVIQTLNLDQPILTGWSYGPLVILDYIRHYGDAGIGGIQFIGGITKLGSEEAFSVVTPEFLANVPAAFSADAEESVRGMDALLDMCFAALTPADRYLMLGYNATVPPHVRQALFGRAFDNEDLLPTIRKPVLITQGASDAVVKPVAAEQHKASIPHAEVDLIPGGGHAPFWDDAENFNRRLQAFVASSRRGAPIAV